MKLIGPFTQILTMDHLPPKGLLSDDQLEIIPNAGILIKDGMIHTLGKFSDLYSEAKKSGWTIDEVATEQVCLPGLIDAHTHICYHGTRSNDYAMRNGGKSYLDIAKQGGGIMDTVTKTRMASQSILEEGLTKRALRHLSEGVTTCEVKSGYGLNMQDELKMLKAIDQVNKTAAIDLIPTCLAAHMKPRDYEGNSMEYLDYVLNEILPVVKSEKLSDRADIFIEDSAFSTDEGKYFLLLAKEMGFVLTVHADQFTAGGSEVAIAVGAVSADHLEASTPKEIQLIADSDLIATALPGASLGLGCPFTPARKLLDAGACVVIASDWNPGSAPMGDLLLQAAILGANEKLSSAETFAGITSRAAGAVGKSDRGVLSEGKFADFIAFDTTDYKEILYHQGKLKPVSVWKKGININASL